MKKVKDEVTLEHIIEDAKTNNACKRILDEVIINE